jgi:hypothetical protein
MNVIQRFNTFSLAARAWFWILGVGVIADIIYLAYLNVETPFQFSDGNGNFVRQDVSQANNACQNALGSWGTNTACRQAAGLEQQKAAFTVGIILLAIVMAVIVLVSAHNTQHPVPQASPAQQAGSLPAATFGGGYAQSWYEAPKSAQDFTSRPGFYEDPTARYPLRYFDGRAWTSRVSAGDGTPEQEDKAWTEHPIVTTPR